MAITISGGKKVTKPGEPVTVTLGATATAGSKTYANALAIEFTGTECHVVQTVTRTMRQGGKVVLSFTVPWDTAAGTMGDPTMDASDFSDPAAPTWLVDSTSPVNPYYDFGYPAAMVGGKYLMIDAPTMAGGKYDLPGCRDVTTFEACAYCLSDKAVIAIVRWGLVRRYYQVAVPWASILDGSAWIDSLAKGRKILTSQGYNADLYLPSRSI
jgi:hypothetical protein